MARKSEVSMEAVFEICEALAAEGRAPTIRGVRERIGGGSPNTIHRLLAEWRACRSRDASGAQPDIPTQLVSAIASALREAAENACADIKDQLAQARAESSELAAEGEALEERCKELAERVSVVTRERDTLCGRVQALEEQLSPLKAEVERLRAELDGARQARAAAEARLEASEVVRQQMEALVERLFRKIDSSPSAASATAA